MINPILPEKDLRVAGLLFNIVEKEDEFEINFENQKSYEIDFIPKFRYANVSELSFLLAKMDLRQQLLVAQRLSLLCSKHSIATFEKRKIRKNYSPIEYIHRLVEIIHKKFGYNTWIEIDDSIYNEEPDFAQIAKLKFLDMPQGASRWSVSFLPPMFDLDRPTYDFFIQLLKVLDSAGICNWDDDYNEMVMDFFQERCYPDTWNDMSKDELKEAEQVAISNRMEVLSYTEGWPARIAREITSSQASASTIKEAFNYWKSTTGLKIPHAVLKDIEEMCRLLSFDFRIHDYEMHVIYNSGEETPIRNGLLFSIDYDDGAFAEECISCANAEEQNSGYVQLADSIVWNLDVKLGYDNKGKAVEQFLFHWNKTKTFEHFNDNYRKLSSGEDGTELRSRVLQKRKRLPAAAVRRKSPNKKRNSSSRKAVLS